MQRRIVAFDAKRLFNNLTGLGNYSRTLVHNLEHFAPDNTYILYSEKVRANPDTVEFTDSSKYKVVGKSGFGRKLWRLFTIRKDIVRDSVELYHGLSHDLPFGRKPNGVKYVVTIHDICFKTFPEMFPKSERIIYHYKYGNSLKKADKIIAISESTKRDILRYYPEVDPSKIEVIYQALNPVYYDLQPIDEERKIVSKYGIKGDFVLYVGSINSRKNLMGVVKGYEKLPQDKRIPLVVIGTGSGYKDSVESYAQANDLDQYITYLDNVTMPENLRSFYRCAKMLVYPSFYEGFGLPVAEALLCQTPVITSAISSLPEAGGKYALYVDPKSEDEIGEAIANLIDNDFLARDLGHRGREFVIENFDSAKLTSQMLNLYDDLLR